MIILVASVISVCLIIFMVSVERKTNHTPQTKENTILNKYSNSIPKIIHQVYFIGRPHNESDLPKGLKNAMNTFKYNNPHYVHRYFDDGNAMKFLVDHFGADSDEVYAFRNLRPRAFKSDFLRCAILWIHGGFYVDSDMLLLSPFEKWIQKNATFVIPVEMDKPFGFSNGLIGSIPRHPMLRIAMDMIIYNVKNKYYPDVPRQLEQKNSFLSVLAVSGPVLMGKVYNRFMGEADEVPHNLNLASTKGIQILGFCKIPPKDEDEWYTTVPFPEKSSVCMGEKVIQTRYPGFRSEQASTGEEHYSTLYDQRKVFI